MTEFGLKSIWQVVLSVSAPFTMKLSPVNVNLQVSRLSAAEPGALGCRLWTGAKDRDGYGRIKVTWLLPDGSTVSKTERAPRIVYMLKLNVHTKCDFPTSADSADGLTVPLEVSHLCHQRLCVNADHLSLEPRSVNMGRMHCKGQRQCHQCHEGYPRCLIWSVPPPPPARAWHNACNRLFRWPGRSPAVALEWSWKAVCHIVSKRPTWKNLIASLSLSLLVLAEPALQDPAWTDGLAADADTRHHTPCPGSRWRTHHLWDCSPPVHVSLYPVSCTWWD